MERWNLEGEEDVKLPGQLQSLSCCDRRLLGVPSRAPHLLHSCPLTALSPHSHNQNDRAKTQIHPIPRCPQTPMVPHRPVGETQTPLSPPHTVPPPRKTAFQPEEVTCAGLVISGGTRNDPKRKNCKQHTSLPIDPVGQEPSAA